MEPVRSGEHFGGARTPVGKIRGGTVPIKSGIGSHAILRADGLIGAALVAVNSVGDMVDPKPGSIAAGALDPNTETFANIRALF